MEEELPFHLKQFNNTKQKQITLKLFINIYSWITDNLSNNILHFTFRTEILLINI